MTKRKERSRIIWYQKLAEYRKMVYVSLFEDVGSVLLGCGCSDGALTHQVARKVQAEKILGIDLDDESLFLARRKKINVIKSDLNCRFPLKDETFDIISADQIIEHLVDVDNFIEEIHRTLKPGGYAVICTENLASWHNIFALILGKQAFSQHISSRFHLGNPFSPHYRELMVTSPHVHIFTIQGLQDIFNCYGFVVEQVRGIGYFPLPLSLAKLFERLNPSHSLFIAVRVRKLER